MEIDLPVRGLEPLEPLGALLLLYLVFLMFVWLFLRPTLQAILRRRTLPRLLGALSLILRRLLLFGLLLLGFLWALVAIGWADSFYEWLSELGEIVIEIPYIGFIVGIPVVLLLLIALAYTVVRPVFSRPGRK